jgi:hypothetical protein
LKSNLNFCVLQTDEWFTIDSPTPTLRRNLNEHPIFTIQFNKPT